MNAAERRGLWLGFLGVAIFALTLPMTRLAVGTAQAPLMSGLFVALGRAAVAAALSVAITWSPRAPWPRRADWLPLVLTSAGVVFGFPLFTSVAMRYVEAVHASVIVGVLPLATALVGALLHRQRPSAAFWACALLGSALVIAFALLRSGSGLRLHVADTLLLAAMACAGLYAKPGRALPRGPGQWLPLSEKDAFVRSPARLPGSYLDGSSWRGALVLTAVLGVAVLLHFMERPRSPYRAVELLLGFSAVLPVFLTGRASELPIASGSDPRGTLRRILRGLRRASLRAVPLARLPLGSSMPDELRLLVQPRGALSGLMAIEVGADYALGLGGVVTEPYVLLRVREGSACAELLGAHAQFQRGRKPEERVAVLRPKLPTVAETISLVSELCRLVTQSATPARPSSAKSSAGSGASPRKPARASSPAQAMTLP